MSALFVLPPRYNICERGGLKRETVVLHDGSDGLVDLEGFCDRCTAFGAQIVAPKAKKIKVTRHVSKFCVTAPVTNAKGRW